MGPGPWRRAGSSRVRVLRALLSSLIQSVSYIRPRRARVSLALLAEWIDPAPFLMAYQVRDELTRPVRLLLTRSISMIGYSRARVVLAPLAGGWKHRLVD